MNTIDSATDVPAAARTTGASGRRRSDRTSAAVPMPARPTVVTSRYHVSPIADTRTAPGFVNCPNTPPAVFVGAGSSHTRLVTKRLNHSTAYNDTASVARSPAASGTESRRRTALTTTSPAATTASGSSRLWVAKPAAA